MSGSLDETRGELVAYLCTLQQSGRRTFTMDDIDMAPCAARTSRSAMRHWLDELEWEKRIARTVGSASPTWRFTAGGFTSSGARDTSTAT